MAADDAEVDERELARRQAQRELQKLVLRLKAEGADKATIEKEKSAFKAQQNFKKPETMEKAKQKFDKYTKDVEKKRAKEDKKKRKREEKEAVEKGEEIDARPTDKEGKLEYAKKKGANHDVVVIPCGYKGQQDAFQRAHDLAAKIKERLASRKIDTWIDQRTTMLPGDKFKFWEEAGVRLRVEIGPKDVSVEPPTCTVSLAGKVGTVATRQKGVSLEGNSLMVALQKFGLEKAAPIADDEDYVLEDEKETTEPAAKKRKKAETDYEVEGNVSLKSRSETAKPAKKSKKKKLVD
eukprot:TRINITY_DN56085_c0_g1_i1.p1 TRINITY_DN56085_c0_g1~~TRINITY_DN56085_c0_g1_i1.p1  ORF type:complete len:294 (+),score=94.92 TRINITY_DN56085_c0_g1_i1:129-1010(+)